jgi:hypothetical protein
MGLKKKADVEDILGMNDFSKGMNSVGQLFPPPSPYSDYPPPNSAWKGVADSFRQTGDSIRAAVKEFSDAQRESKQTS